MWNCCSNPRKRNTDAIRTTLPVNSRPRPIGWFTDSSQLRRAQIGTSPSTDDFGRQTLRIPSSFPTSRTRLRHRCTRKRIPRELRRQFHFTVQRFNFFNDSTIMPKIQLQPRKSNPIQASPTLSHMHFSLLSPRASGTSVNGSPPAHVRRAFSLLLACQSGTKMAFDLAATLDQLAP